MAAVLLLTLGGAAALQGTGTLHWPRAVLLHTSHARGHAYASANREHADVGPSDLPGMDFLPSRRSALVAAGVASAFSGLAGGSTAVEATAVDVSVPTTSLGSLKISRTIQGYWQLAGIHGAYNEADAVENMRRHFSAGVTTLDTADIYGPSELIVGKCGATQRAPADARQGTPLFLRLSLSLRAFSTFTCITSPVFVGEQPSAVPCTKFCCFRGLQTIEMDEVRARVRKQCERLKVDALPLVAFFWADYSVRRRRRAPTTAANTPAAV
eukprot:6193117-Pleurochrysis_carterae.AAC.1